MHLPANNKSDSDGVFPDFKAIFFYADFVVDDCKCIIDWILFDTENGVAVGRILQVGGSG